MYFPPVLNFKSWATEICFPGAEIYYK